MKAFLVGVAILAAGLMVAVPAADADLFTFTSCHLSDGCGTNTSFGTVTLTQSGTSVNFDVVLSGGNRFVETGAGGGSLFVFNDTVSGSTITGITATLNGVTQTTGLGGTFPGGFSGLADQSPFQADGAGDFTAKVFCTVTADCNGGSTPNINDLHFTVTNATLAQLETANAQGEMFVADIFCATCPGPGFTGVVDVSSGGGTGGSTIPEPATLLLLGSGLLGLGLAGRVRGLLKR